MMHHSTLTNDLLQRYVNEAKGRLTITIDDDYSDKSLTLIGSNCQIDKLICTEKCILESIILLDIELDELVIKCPVKQLVVNGKITGSIDSANVNTSQLTNLSIISSIKLNISINTINTLESLRIDGYNVIDGTTYSMFSWDAETHIPTNLKKLILNNVLIGRLNLTRYPNLKEVILCKCSVFRLTVANDASCILLKCIVGSLTKQIHSSVKTIDTYDEATFERFMRQNNTYSI